MRKYEHSTRFKKDIKKALKQTSPKKDISALKEIMDMLAKDELLHQEKRGHSLVGEWIGYRECHITA